MIELLRIKYLVLSTTAAINEDEKRLLKGCWVDTRDKHPAEFIATMAMVLSQYSKMASLRSSFCQFLIKVDAAQSIALEDIAAAFGLQAQFMNISSSAYLVLKLTARHGDRGVTVDPTFYDKVFDLYFHLEHITNEKLFVEIADIP